LKVYLAGPIAGLTDGQARGWRDTVTERLAQHGIKGISPLRCEPPAKGKFEDATKLTKAFCSEILAKNTFDVRNTDLTLAYLPLPKDGNRHSYGTMWEVGATRILGNPVIIVSDDPIMQTHPLFGGTIDWVFSDMNEAVTKCIQLLEDYKND
jgi:nucleoside 2-deoxyribosyltransferase